MVASQALTRRQNRRGAGRDERWALRDQLGICIHIRDDIGMYVCRDDHLLLVIAISGERSELTEAAAAAAASGSVLWLTADAGNYRPVLC